jgi:hypothetical protein
MTETSAQKGWVSFCPRGEECNKGHKRLGWDVSEDEARARISLHLQRSEKHYLSAEEADAAAVAAELMEEEKWQEPPMQPASWKGGKAGGKGKGKESWSSSSWRSSPYQAEPEIPMQVRLRGNDPASQREKIIAAISKAEAGTRAASRMARQAFQAFEDEANVLREALEAMRNC